MIHRRSLAFAFISAGAIAAGHHSPAVAVVPPDQSPVHLRSSPRRFVRRGDKGVPPTVGIGGTAYDRYDGTDIGASFASPPYADTAITAIVLRRQHPAFGSSHEAARQLSTTPRKQRRARTRHRLRSASRVRRRRARGALLWLYDVWVALYGQQFADAQVLVEQRGEVPTAAWDSALALSAAERRIKWKSRWWPRNDATVMGRVPPGCPFYWYR